MRVRARVSGVVQGVGYRPFVYGLASELGLSGFVFNDAEGVLVEVEGESVDAFVARLRREAPPLASVSDVVCEAVPEVGERAFVIRESPRGGAPDAPISADVATCDACLAELFDPSDRRYRYPFINCTDCGPRFTIVTGVPYDRPWTTMAGFAMCARLPARVRRPARPPLPRPAQRLPGLRPARDGLRRGGARAAATAGSSPSRASAASTWPAAPTTRPPWRACAPASTARSARSP